MINTLWALMILYINISNFQNVTSHLDQLSTNPSLQAITIDNLREFYELICETENSSDSISLKNDLLDLRKECHKLLTKSKNNFVKIEKMNDHAFLTFFEPLYYMYHKNVWKQNESRYNYDFTQYLFTKSNQIFTIVNGSLATLITIHKYVYLALVDNETKMINSLISEINAKLESLNE